MTELKLKVFIKKYLSAPSVLKYIYIYFFTLKSSHLLTYFFVDIYVEELDTRFKQAFFFLSRYARIHRDPKIKARFLLCGLILIKAA